MAACTSFSFSITHAPPSKVNIEKKTDQTNTCQSAASCSKKIFTSIESNVTLAMPKHHEKENIRVLKVCEDLGTHVQTYDYYDPEINPDTLNLELSDILSMHEHSKPIPQTIVDAASEENGEKYPVLRRLKTIANKIVSQNSAVILPGGISIHPKFYGEEDSHGETRGFYDFDPRRTILEFFLINSCKTTGTPLLTICRGHQMINIYHGGTLDRDTLDEIQLSKVRESSSILTTTPFKAPLTVFFNHRQTVTKIGEGFRNFMIVNVLKDLDTENKKLEQYFAEAEGTVAAGRETFEELGAEEIYDRALKALQDKNMMYKNIEEQLKFLEQDNIVMAAENLFGAPILGVQFHPEDIDEMTSSALPVDRKGNIEIFRIFALAAKTASQRRLVINEMRNFSTN